MSLSHPLPAPLNANPRHYSQDDATLATVPQILVPWLVAGWLVPIWIIAPSIISLWLDLSRILA